MREPSRRRVAGFLRQALAVVAALVAVALSASAAFAQAQMPDPKMISGRALPDGSAPAGSVSVRVIRGSFDNNVVGQPVEFTIAGKTRTVKTDGDGRAIVTNLAPGTEVKATTTLDGAKIDSESVTLASTGIRFVLVGVDPDAGKREAEAQRLASGPAVKGIVVLAPESQTIVELQDERLNIFYALDILNTARTPVDPGGPLVFDLPTGAANAAIMDGSSKQATVAGSHVTVTGPFAPGTTSVQIGYEMPYDGATAEISQRLPAALQQVTVVMPRAGGLDVRSPQLTAKQDVMNQGQGQPLVMATGPAIPAGGTLSFEILNLPHRPLWPRDLALTLAGAIMAVGIWSAVFVKRP